MENLGLAEGGSGHMLRLKLVGLIIEHCEYLKIG